MVGIGEDERVPALTRVRIVGPSMEPALRNGEWWLVRRTTRVAPGDAVVLIHPRRPDALIVKRLVRRAELSGGGVGWWVEGDNPEASEDSRQFGAVPDRLVIGRAVLRYHPLVRR